MHRYLFLALSGLLILADQLSKWFVTQHVLAPLINSSPSEIPAKGFLEWITQSGELLPYVELTILPFFNIVMVWNRGVSFGMFNQATDYGPLMLIALSFAITIWFLVWMFRTQDKMLQLGIAMIIGGAIGNVIDRMRFGAVIDFLDFHVGGWHYPAFNVADSCIVIGVAFLMIYTLFFEKRLHQPPSNV